MVPDAGHAAMEPGIRRGIIEALTTMASRPR